jgi:hypothetical protein
MQTKVCARKKLKQEPERSTNQISEKRSPFSLGLKAYCWFGEFSDHGWLT